MPTGLFDDIIQPASTNKGSGLFDDIIGTRRTPEQVRAEVQQAQARRDAEVPPETQGWLGRVAGSDPVVE